MWSTVFSTLFFLAVGIAIILYWSVLPDAAGNRTPSHFYNASSAWLSLNGKDPITISFYKITSNHTKGELLGTADLNGNASSVTGSVRQENTTLIHDLTIEYGSGDLNATHNVTVDSVKIDFEMTTFLSKGKWQLTALTLTYKIKTEDEETKEHTTGINVALKTGYTSAPSDSVCQNGYLICAPSGLCLTCAHEKFEPIIKNDTTDTVTANIDIPYMKLQPFSGNTTQKYGYNWDCDPVMTVGTWEGLLLSLWFAILVLWAVSYLTGVGSPSKFDDPHSQPISVPLTE